MLVHVVRILRIGYWIGKYLRLFAVICWLLFLNLKSQDGSRIRVSQNEYYKRDT